MQVRQAKGSFDMQRKEVSRLRVEEEIRRHVRFGKTLWVTDSNMVQFYLTSLNWT